MSRTKLIIVDDIGEIVETKERAMALGFFDGIHIGHRQIIKKVFEVSKERNLTSTVLSFIDFPTKESKTIISIEERLDILTALGIEEFIVIRFSDEVKNLLPEEFFYSFLIEKFNSKCLFTGEDYSFGRGGIGKIDLLKKLSYENSIDVIVVPDVKVDNRRVSSTWVRQTLEEGNIPLMNTLLGEGGTYAISGVVLEGKKLGRLLGFPTINQMVPKDKYLCRLGVYRSVVEIDGKEMPAISNVGRRPTVENTDNVNCETYIYNFNGDLYGQVVKVTLCEFIRDEKKFGNSSELKNQVDYDKKKVAELWKIELED